MTFSFLERCAAIGAATTPPKINPKIVCQPEPQIKVKKVNELANETKNSAKLTDPITNLGFLPLAIRVDETTGPQPPPPIASKNPPAVASQPTLFNCFLFWCFLITFTMITTPKINVYPPTIGLIIEL